MFRFDPSKAEPDLLGALQGFLDKPRWIHGPQVVPIWAALARSVESNDALPWQEALPGGLVAHLRWSLDTWSAFRGPGLLQNKHREFETQLPAFVRDVREAIDQAADAAAHLVSIREERLETLYQGLEEAVIGFGGAVKKASGQVSWVLPSKTAHLLFPAVIPAFDHAVVADEALNRLMPPHHRGRKSFRTWLRLCWWILRRFDEAGALGEGRRMVVDHLLANWTISVMDPESPPAGQPTLTYADTFVAEYTLISLADQGFNVDPL